jgi:very-short-patch-repair endonuclease
MKNGSQIIITDEDYEEYFFANRMIQQSNAITDPIHRFGLIREAYGFMLPKLINGISKGYLPSPYFFTWKFTPIEENVWFDIRGLGLPFYPQLPVLNFFIDFGDPFHKIGIEWDGKLWHQDKEKDRIRDTKLAKEGWRIYRFTGAKTYVNEEDFFEDIIDDGYESSKQERQAREAEFAMESTTGFLQQLRKEHYFPFWDSLRASQKQASEGEAW